MRRLILCILAAFAFGTPAGAQTTDWGNLDPLMLTLSPTGSMEAAYFLPDTADPASARRALGVVYAHVPGSAGTVSIHAAVFARVGTGWQVVAPVVGLFGQGPRDPVFLETRAELTTITLGPNEPRCCPTVPARWSIDLTTGQAVRLN